MKRKNNEGFTLIETLIAIVVLGIVVVPVCSSLVMSFRMNEKADALLQDQLAVSSVVETLMAEGISEQYVRTDENTPVDDNYGWMEVESGKIEDRFPGVAVETVRVTNGEGENQVNEPYYDVTISAGDVSVITKIRAAAPTPTPEPTPVPNPQEGGGTE